MTRCASCGQETTGAFCEQCGAAQPTTPTDAPSAKPWWRHVLDVGDVDGTQPSLLRGLAIAGVCIAIEAWAVFGSPNKRVWYCGNVENHCGYTNVLDLSQPLAWLAIAVIIGCFTLFPVILFRAARKRRRRAAGWWAFWGIFFGPMLLAVWLWSAHRQAGRIAGGRQGEIRP